MVITGINDNPQDRIDIFAEFGYETLIIQESELNNESEVTEKINNFYNGMVKFQTIRLLGY